MTDQGRPEPPPRASSPSETLSRRSLLRRGATAVATAGTAGVLGAVTARSATGGTEPTDRIGTRSLPVRATGRRTREVTVTDDALVVRERFESAALKRTYGETAIDFEPLRVALDPLLPEGTANRTTEDGDDPGPLTELLDGTRDALRVEYEDAGVFGTAAEHRAAESLLADRRGPPHVTAWGPDPGEAPAYDGPLFQYASGALAERKAPINVAWHRDLTDDPRWVKRSMNDAGWGSLVVLSGHRFVLVPGADAMPIARVEDRHVKRQIAVHSTAQHHARLWRLPRHADRREDGHADRSDADHADRGNGGHDYGVIGSAHYDPWLHGYLGEDPDWAFDEARGEVLETWRERGLSRALQPAGNGAGYTAAESADGRIGLVTPS